MRVENIAKIYLRCAVAGYIIKFLTDVIMYIYTLGSRSDIYYDVYYLVIPQAVASLLLVGYHSLFFRKEYFGFYFKISASFLIMINIAYMVFIAFYDRHIGYLYYFSVTAVINFFCALFMKTNIIPEKKDGAIEAIPLIFEFAAFVCMIISALSAFYSFPFVDGYHSLDLAFKMNMAAELLMCILYVACMRNDCEFMRDNMLVDDDFQ